MTFQNPVGLWLLLGIPVLILIYLIKSQHEDKSVSSTYIWHLSTRFMKRRLPVQRLRKILMFILQLLMIASLALIAAKPALTDGSRYDYIAILDASASMLTADEDGVTRFERAMKQVEALADYVKRGHTLSVILASDEAAFLIQGSDSESEIKHALKNAACSPGGCNISEALELAQLAIGKSSNPQVILFTDHTYGTLTNVNVVDLSEGEWNVSVDGLSASHESDGIRFTGSLTSHGVSASVSVGLRIDGVTVDAKLVDCTADTTAEVSFTRQGLTHFDTAEIFIEAADGLAEDNAYALCNPSGGPYKVLLISQSPLYLESVLNALGNCEVTVIPAPADTEMYGFDLYIFDGYAMNRYPDDGSILMFAALGLPDGLSAGEVITEETPLTLIPGRESEFYRDLTLRDTVVSTYVPLLGDGTWESLLSCGEDTVLMTKESVGGLRFSVCSIDLHDSNLPMQTDFVLLMRNIVENSVPMLLRDTDYTYGEPVTVSIPPDTKALYVELPDESVVQLSTDHAVALVPTASVGLYTAVAAADEGGSYADFFVHLPVSESHVEAGGDLTLKIPEPEESQSDEDAIREMFVPLAAVLLLLLLIEWGCYCREQY